MPYKQNLNTPNVLPIWLIKYGGDSEFFISNPVVTTNTHTFCLQMVDLRTTERFNLHVETQSITSLNLTYTYNSFTCMYVFHLDSNQIFFTIYGYAETEAHQPDWLCQIYMYLWTD